MPANDYPTRACTRCEVAADDSEPVCWNCGEPWDLYATYSVLDDLKKAGMGYCIKAEHYDRETGELRTYHLPSSIDDVSTHRSEATGAAWATVRQFDD